MAGAPSYDPELVPVDANYLLCLYPYYGYGGFLGFFPPTVGGPDTKSDAPASRGPGG